MMTEEATKQMIEAIQNGAIGSGPKGVVKTTLDRAVPSEIYNMIMEELKKTPQPRQAGLLRQEAEDDGIR